MLMADFLKRGLLGYQPFFFPDGLITGTGYQFFGNLIKDHINAHPEFDSEIFDFKENDSSAYNRGKFGNLYLPGKYGDLEVDSSCYYQINDNQVHDFAKYNLALQKMYNDFVTQALSIASAHGVQLESMIEVGANTCLFPFMFYRHGLNACHGADVVDYSEVVNFISAIDKSKVSFHHMKDDSDATWRNLPKADLAWSYAVLLHQSNPLTHLTRLASLAKKALFVMTLSDDDEFKSQSDMSIKYISANSYYTHDFPNCFDVTIVSKELIKYSMQRLGFSTVLEICPKVPDFIDKEASEILKYWHNKHCFIIGIRDECLTNNELEDYTIYPERSPYNGNNVLVYEGNNTNIVLIDSRYYIIPHGQTAENASSRFKSFKNITNAYNYINNLDSEKQITPILLKKYQEYNLVKINKKVYLCRHGEKIDYNNSEIIDNLHSLSNIDEWTYVIGAIPPKLLDESYGIIKELFNNYVIYRVDNNKYVSTNLTKNDSNSLSANINNMFEFSGASVHDVKIQILTKLSNDEFINHNCNTVLFLDETTKTKIERTPENTYILFNSNSTPAEFRSLESAWEQLFALRSNK